MENNRLQKWSKRLSFKVLFIIIPLFVFSATTLLAQKRLDISLKNEPIVKAMSEIEKKTGYKFVYSPSIVELSKKVSVSLTNEDLSNVLKEVFKGVDVTYEIKGTQIILKVAEQTPQSRQKQQDIVRKVKVTGTVTDENDQPVSYVTVMSAKNPKNGTMTDDNGKYTLELTTDDAVRFSFIGYKDVDINVGKKSVVDCRLEPDTENLDEIVVVAFGEQRKAAMSSSVSTVKSNEIMKSPVSNISNALAGRVTGLTTMQGSGQPGSDESTMYIRGAGTWNSSEPLYVIDGVERNQAQFLRIDPSEVESFTILKDAAATALYGSKAANGVIVLTTKRGKEGQMRINVNTSLTLNTPTRTPEYLDSYESLVLYNEALVNDGGEPLYSQEDLMHYKNQDDPYRYPNTDWYDLMMKEVTPQVNVSANIRGGSKTVRYFISGSYMYQDGQLKTSQGRIYNPKFSYERYTFRSNVDIMVTKHFTISLDLGGGITDRTQPSDGSDIFAYMNRIPSWIMPATNPDGSYAGTTDFPSENPYYRLNTRGNYRVKNNTITSSIKLEYDFSSVIKGLSASVRAAYDSNFGNQKTWTETVPTYQLLSPAGKEEKYEQLLERKFFGTGSGSTSSTRKIYGEASLKWNRTFKNHSISVLGIANLSEYRTTTSTPYNSISYIARINYAYKQKYFLEANGAYRGSENFAPGHRFGFFPSVSAGWNVHNEKFMKDVKFINNLKLRASFGVTGNDYANTRFIYKEGKWKTGTSGYAYFGDELGSSYGYSTEPVIANPGATWETAYQTNIGLDVTFFKKRINFTVDRFFEKRTGILMSPNSTPSLLGIGVSDMNIGKVNKDGWEFELGYRQNVGKNWSYYAKGNFSFVKNEIIFKDEPEDTPEWLKAEGHALGQYWGYVVEGFFRNQEEINNSPAQNVGGAPIPGDFKYKDIDGNGIINEDDKVIIGYPKIPRITYGVSLGFAYKGFSFDAHFQGSAQSSVFLSNYLMYEFYNRGKVLDIHKGRWTPETAETATYPALHIGATSQNHVRNTFYQKDNPYLRLKSVEIAYTLESKGLKKVGLQSLRTYINGVNLMTWDKLKVVDPETPTGSTGAVYPQTMGVSLGFNFTF
ncbi:MAG: TonB-dependent receptor [Bacteroidales bacterium]|nr:TonB-dependent receptor [Bacteroidales bacterium]